MLNRHRIVTESSPNRHRIDSKLLIPRHAKGTCSFCSPSDFNFPLTRARAHPVYRSHAHIILDFDWKFECFISESSLHEHPRKIIMHGWRKWSHSNHVCICAYGNVNIQIMIDLFTSLPLTFHFFSVIWVEGLWSYVLSHAVLKQMKVISLMVIRPMCIRHVLRLIHSIDMHFPIATAVQNK